MGGAPEALLVDDEPLYRAFDRIGERYGTRVLYDPAEVPSFPTTLRQRGSGVETLLAAVAGTNLEYVAVARDTFVVAPGTRLTREYAAEVLVAWRAGRYRSPDRAVAEAIRLRVGPTDVLAATGARVTVTGEVRDRETGERLVGANVLHPASRSGTVTEVDGSFSIELPTGDQRIEIRSIGYVTQPVALEVAGAGALPTLGLRVGAAALSEVVVSARSERVRLRESTGGLTRLTPRELSLLPAPTGELDVLQALTRGAGVATVAEGAAAISVRGGGLDANLVRQGGIPVLYPAHALGFYPVFHPDLVSGVELYRGYVPAEFGGRAASVVDVGWRTGDFERWHLRGSVGFLASRIGVDGPLWKDRVSIVAGARRSHLNWVLRQQRPRTIRTSAAGFADVSVGITARWTGGRLDVRGVYAEDDFNYAQRFGFAYVNEGARVQLRQRLGTAATLRAAVTTSRFEGQQLGLFAFPGPSTFSSGLRQDEAEVSVSREFAPALRGEAGAAVARYRTADRRRERPEGSGADAFRFADPDLRAVTAFATASYEFAPAWTLETGVRVLAAESLREAGPVARYDGLPIEGNLVDREDAAASTFRHPAVVQPRGRLTFQRPGGAHSVGLAYARLAQPVFQLSPTVTPTPADIFFAASEFLPVTTSEIVSLAVASEGRERAFRRLGYEFGVYYRRVRDSHLALGGQLLRASDTPEQGFYTADGFAAGAEATLELSGLRHDLTLTYGYGRSFLDVDRAYPALRAEPSARIPATTDLPHQAALTYAYRPSGRFSFGAGFTYVSGRPFTGIEALLPQGGSLVPVFTLVNGQRLPPTHRLDLSLRVDNSEIRSRGLRAGFGIALYNVYERENPFAAFYREDLGRLTGFQFAIVGEVVPALTIDLQWD